jgi:hypothetical protein
VAEDTSVATASETSPASEETEASAPSSVLPSALALSSTWKAGVVLVALPILAEYDLPRPTATAVLEALGVSRARAYEVRASLQAVLPSLQRPVGRPPRAPSTADPSCLVALCGEVRDFLLANPGTARVAAQRRWYSDAFRHFVLDLLARHEDLDLE